MSGVRQPHWFRMSGARQRLCAFMLVATGACTPTLRTPRTGPFPLNARFTIVDFPPPPARIETLPPDPGPGCVWVDGYFSWQGRRWSWVPGAFRTQQPNCYRSEMSLAWVPAESGALLYYAEPGWYESSPNEAGTTRALTSEECAPAPKSLADCRQR